MEKRLAAMLEAVKTVEPALAELLCSSLSDEQKARFNTLGAAAGRPGVSRH